MKAYTRRFVKFLLLIVILFFLILFVYPWIKTGNTFRDTFNALSGSKNISLVVMLVIIYAFLYPLINFRKKDRYINGTFEDNREDIEKSMEVLNYIKLSEDDKKIVYKRKSLFARIVMLGEDTIEIYKSVKPVVFSGPLRDLKRIDAVLDSKLLGKQS
jgi:hypothetical protein